MTDAFPRTIQAALAAQRSGRISAQDLVHACLQRINEQESRIRAWVRVDADGAKTCAAQLDRLRESGGWAGLLHGIPVGIKDLMDVSGCPTEAGSPLFRGCLASQDADVVAQLRAQGAIILGKTVTTELASFDPSPTANPWNVGHTPGGSSSGSAAAVAAQMCYGAVGTQTGGSIVRPASYCGVVSLKPSFGRLSTGGIRPFAVHLDHPGPMAACVEDLELVFRAMDGTRGVKTVCPTTAPRLGLLRNFFWDQTDAASKAVLEPAIERLVQKGAHVHDVRLPEDFAEVWPKHRLIMAAEAAWVYKEAWKTRRNDFGPKISELLSEGMAASALELAGAFSAYASWPNRLQEFFRDCDAWCIPATPTAAPATLASTGDPKFNSPWSFVGFPTLGLPVGVTAQGLPVSLQLVGPKSYDESLIALGRWCESILGGLALPPQNAAA